MEIIPAPVLEEKREDNSKLPMAKKKQSKAAWRKRGLSFEEDTRVARERAEQELRTGGSLEHTSDEHLFVIDAGTGCSKAAAPGEAAQTGENALRGPKHRGESPLPRNQ